jgi:hypothetical protein
MLLMAIASTAFLALPCQARSPDPSSGAFWYPLCNERDTSSDGATMCRIYIEGFVGGSTTMVVMLLENPKFCLPAGATTDQARLVVVRFMETMPELLHLSFNQLIYMALATSFSCSNPVPPR